MRRDFFFPASQVILLCVNLKNTLLGLGSRASATWRVGWSPAWATGNPYPKPIKTLKSTLALKIISRAAVYYYLANTGWARS